MADLLNIGVTALQAYQTALVTTSNNVANANTPGYSRQVVQFATQPGQYTGSGYVGSGVEVSSIERMSSDLLATQLNTATSGSARLTAFSGIATSISNQIASATGGLGAALSSLSSALQGVATDPTSVPNRETLLSQLQGVANSFNQMSAYLDSQKQTVDSGINSAVSSINTLSRSIASLNQQIVQAQGSGHTPNDLLDQRAQALNQLSQQVGLTTTQNTDGSINVYVGNGQALVVSSNAGPLSVGQNPLDPSQPELTLGGQAVTRQLSGGTLGGLLDAESQLIAPTRSEIGRIATTLSLQINKLNSQGLDLNGNQGTALLSAPTATVQPATTNTGTGGVSVSYANTQAFQPDDYVLSFDGSNWQLHSATTGAAVAMTGSGTAADPLVANGLQFVVSPGAAAGDRFMIKPFDSVAASMTVTTTDPNRIAAAAALAATPGAANTGTLAVGSLNVTDSTAGGFLSTVNLQFLTPTTYSINGAGSFSYTPGSPISLNGYQLTLTGTPAAGDTLAVQANTGAVGDNTNALLMAQVASQPLLNGGTTSLTAANSALIAKVGGAAQQAGLASQAQDAITTDAQSALSSLSGVNLDEEASNLARYQQAYQAMAQMIGVAEATFQSLLTVLKG